MTDLKAPQVPPLERRADVAPLVYPVYREEDALSLFELVSWFHAERWLAAALVVLATLGALGFAFLMPPVYRAETLLAPVKHEGNEVSAIVGQLGELAALVGSLPGGAASDRSAEFVAMLRSRALALDFIRENELKRALFSERWDPVSGRWRADAEAPSDLEAYRLFEREVRHVDVDRRTGLVSLAIEWREPRQAAAWANALVAEVNARSRAAAIEEARRSIAYLERQVRAISAVDVRQAVYRLIEQQTKAMAIAAAREEYAFRVIDPAVAPEEPSAPKPLLLALAGFALGLALAVALVLTRRALHAWRAYEARRRGAGQTDS